MNGAEPASFNAFLNFKLDNNATHISKGETGLQQYLNASHIFSYGATDRKLLEKRTEGGLKTF